MAPAPCNGTPTIGCSENRIVRLSETKKKEWQSLFIHGQKPLVSEMKVKVCILFMQTTKKNETMASCAEYGIWYHRL